MNIDVLSDCIVIKPNPNGSYFAIKIMRYFADENKFRQHAFVGKRYFFEALCAAYEMLPKYGIDVVIVLDPYGLTCLEFNTEDGIIDALMSYHEWW